MHIGFVTSIRYHDRSGARTRATRIYRLLSENHKVTQFNVNTTNRGASPPDIVGENLGRGHRQIPHRVRQFLTIVRAYKACQRYRLDVVYSYESWMLTPVIGWMMSRQHGTPHVVGVNDHRSGSGIIGTIFNEHFRRYILNRADVIVLESKTLYRNFEEQGIEPRATVTVPTGIDTDEFYYPNVPLAEEPTVFYVGRDKDLALLLESIPLVRKQVPHAEVRIAGVDRDEVDHPQADHQAVNFLGFVKQEQLYEELARAHVCVIPYRDADTAGRPVKLLEYMSAGKAIVATDLPFNTQMLTDGENGVVTPPTPEAFAEGITRVLENDDLRERLETRGREDIRAYSLDSMRSNLERAIELAVK